MQNKWRIYFVLLAAGTAILLFFYWDGCNTISQKEKDIETLRNLRYIDSSELIKKTNELGQLTVTAQAFQLSQKELDRYVTENLDLKQKLANAYNKVNSVSSTITEFKVDTIEIPVPVKDTIPCGDIDKTYPVASECYSFDFNFKNRQGQPPQFLITNFIAPDTSTSIIGVRKYGFLNMRRQLVSEQVHSNRCIEIKGVKTIVKAEAKPKTLKKVAIGFAMGVAATIYLQNKLQK